jgi:hypothetical protein
MVGDQWTRNEKIEACAVVVTIVGIVLALFNHEVRVVLHLEEQGTLPIPQTTPKPVTPYIKPSPPPQPSSPDDLSGIWSASYPGGPLRVSIRQAGNRVVATLLKGNAYVPAGEITFHGTYNSNPFHIQQICTQMNFTSAHWVNAQIQVIDGDHMTEDCAECGGCPVMWHRLMNSTSQ